MVFRKRSGKSQTHIPTLWKVLAGVRGRFFQEAPPAGYGAAPRKLSAGFVAAYSDVFVLLCYDFHKALFAAFENNTGREGFFCICGLDITDLFAVGGNAALFDRAAGFGA